MLDGIFEPLEELTVTNLMLLNDGDMTLPAGSIVSLNSSETITAIEPNGFPIPEILPGQTLVLQHTFKLKLADVAPPTAPGPLNTRFTFNSNATLLKRQFMKCGVIFGVNVAWPINIASIASPTQMARKEVRPFLVTIENKSLIPYAAGPETEACVILKFEPGLIPQDPRAVGAIGQPWTLELPILPLAPQTTQTLSVDVMCWEGSEFFNRNGWKAELLLRRRLIEYSEQQVRTCPDWNQDFADVAQDVIMFTAEHIQLADYLAWKTICNTLKLGLWMWDSERFKGISQDGSTQEPHGPSSWRQAAANACIVFPSNPNGPQGMNFADIVAHFRKWSMSTGELSVTTSKQPQFVDDPGFLFFGGDPSGIDKQMAWQGEPVDIADYHLKFEGKHLIFKPDDKDIMEKANSLTKKISEKDPAFPYRLMAIEKEVDRESFLKYTYGTLIIKKIPFKKFSKFVYAPRGISSSIGTATADVMSAIDSGVAGEMPLLSPYGQCMLLLLSVLPVEKKLAALATEQHPMRFVLQDGKKTFTFYPTDLLKIMLYRDLRSDLEHEEKDYPHAVALQNAILAQPRLLQNANVRNASFYALERLSEKKSIFSSNKPITTVKDNIKAEMFKTFKEDDYKQIKKDNEAAVKEHKHFRMHQYFDASVAWLFATKKKK